MSHSHAPTSADGGPQISKVAMQSNDLTRRSFLRVPLAAGAGLTALGAARAQDAPAASERPAGIRRGRLKQAGVHWCYGGPLEELAALCARLGVSGIDVVHPDKWPVLIDHGLECTMTPAFERGFGIGRGLNRKEHHEGHLEVVRERIDRNAEAGFKNVLVFSGNRADDLVHDLLADNITVYGVHVGGSTVPAPIVDITSRTGGAVFNPGDTQALGYVFQRIDEMQETRIEKTSSEAIDDYAPWALAAIGLLAAALLASFGLRYTPW